MRVITKARLRAFWESPGRSGSEAPLRSWHKAASQADWQKWADIKSSFPTASPVGNCTVFNIGGGKFRLVTRVHYVTHIVYILKVMTHSEYDNESWKAECGCFSPPPLSTGESKVDP